MEQLKVNMKNWLLTVINPHKECITVFNIANEDIFLLHKGNNFLV